MAAAPTRWPQLAEQPTPAARLAKAGQRLLEVVEHLGDGRPAGRPNSTARALWYEPLMDAVYDDAEVRKADLHQLEQIAAGYPSRERFLTELTLDPPDATSDQAGVPLLDEDYLILSTIHSAKGQEWKIGACAQRRRRRHPVRPRHRLDAELEEERRLLYVAMTRAKDELHLMMPQRFYVHQQTPIRRPARLCAAHAASSPRPCCRCSTTCSGRR